MLTISSYFSTFSFEILSLKAWRPCLQQCLFPRVSPLCACVFLFVYIFYYYYDILLLFYYLIIYFLEGHPYREQRGVSGQGPESERWAWAGKHRLHPGQSGQLHRNVSCWGEYSLFKVQHLSYDSGYKRRRTLMNCIKRLWFICDWNYFLLLTNCVRHAEVTKRQLSFTL